MSKKNDLVFQCRKCGHLLFITGTPEVQIKKIKKLIKIECPNCGEERYANWTFVRMGNYDKEYGNKEQDDE